MATLQPVGSFPHWLQSALHDSCHQSCTTEAAASCPEVCVDQQSIKQEAHCKSGSCANLWDSAHLTLKPLLALLAPPTGAALYLQSTGQRRPAAPETQDHNWICSHSSHSTGLGKTMTPSWVWDRRTRDGTATARGLSLG